MKSITAWRYQAKAGQRRLQPSKPLTAALEGVVAKPFSPGVELREETYGDVYTGTADALVAAGIVPAGHFPAWPGMQKTIVTICQDGALGRTRDKGRDAGDRIVEVKTRGQRPTYSCTVRLPDDVGEQRLQDFHENHNEWERRMDAQPRPAPLIDLPGFRSAPKVKLVPKYRADGNVIHLAPRSTWRAESCPA